MDMELFKEDITKQIIEAHEVKNGIVDLFNDNVDGIADYMCNTVPDYDWTRGLFHWCDGSVGIAYLSTTGEIKLHYLSKDNEVLNNII